MIDYKRWLRNAYYYYHGTTEDQQSDMHDLEWDAVAREIAKDPEQYPELRGKDYKGGSLFFLKETDYPEWAKHD